MRATWRAALIVSAISLLVLAGCDDDGESDAGDLADPPRAASYRVAECPMDVPDDANVECGWLSVPENRRDADSRDIELAVARIHSPAEDPMPDPVLQLQGGPGFPSLENIESWTESPILESRDVVLFDQRGVGFSDPNLDCPELDEAIWQNFATTDPGEVEGERLREPLAECRERLLADGVDLDGYNTIESAADVADLRTALDIDEWNLRGVSYGSAIAMEVVRSHPEGVRSVLLDSVVPPDEPFGGVDRARSAQRAFEALYDACAADATCTDAYGDLEALVRSAAASLEDDPHPVTLVDPATGADRDVFITGEDFYAGLFNALYDRDLIPVLPSAVQAIADGDRGLIDLLAQDGVEFVIDQTEGMTISVSCADRQRLLDPDVVEPFVTENAELATLVYLGPIELACEDWTVAANPESFNDLLGDDHEVPVLVMAGHFDPITPPEGSRRVAEALGLEVLVFPAAGHGAVGTECGRSIWFEVMDDPTAPPDTSCMDELGPPEFL